MQKKVCKMPTDKNPSRLFFANFLISANKKIKNCPNYPGKKNNQNPDNFVVPGEFVSENINQSNNGKD